MVITFLITKKKNEQKTKTNAERSCSSTWVSLITQESRGVFVNIIAVVCKVVWREKKLWPCGRWVWQPRLYLQRLLLDEGKKNSYLDWQEALPSWWEQHNWVLWFSVHKSTHNATSLELQEILFLFLLQFPSTFISFCYCFVLTFFFSLWAHCFLLCHFSASCTQVKKVFEQEGFSRQKRGYRNINDIEVNMSDPLFTKQWYLVSNQPSSCIRACLTFLTSPHCSTLITWNPGVFHSACRINIVTHS